MYVDYIFFVQKEKPDFNAYLFIDIIMAEYMQQKLLKRDMYTSYATKSAGKMTKKGIIALKISLQACKH